MPSMFDALNESITGSDKVTPEGLRRTVDFGQSASHKEQMSILKEDDALRESTFLFLLSQAQNELSLLEDAGGCVPSDSEDSYEKFRLCIETQTLRKALKTRDREKVQDACDEINSNRDARAVHERLSSTEKNQVQLKAALDRRGQKREVLNPTTTYPQ